MNYIRLFGAAGILFWSGAACIILGQVVSFTDVTSASGISTPVAGMSWAFDAAAEDFDNDGSLDLFVISHDAGSGTPHVLLHDNGNGTFSRLATNLDNVRMPYTAMICDMNNDGLVDMAPSDGDVCSYYGINKGGNLFTTGNSFCTNGHGNAAGDFDNAGRRHGRFRGNGNCRGSSA